MPLKSYSVLKCKPIKGLTGSRQSPHYQVLATDQHQTLYRIAINIQSQVNPSDLLYYADENFQHPITQRCAALNSGLTPLQSQPDGMALDYLRGNLFDYRQMRILPEDLPGADNDLNEKIDKYVQWAIAMEDAQIYAFGASWGPEKKSDRYFGFRPGRGIHDIHMNQGNSGKWADDNGPWQDGGLLFHFPGVSQWVAIFLAFQSQTFHTDDRTGNPILFPKGLPEEAEAVRIIAAILHAGILETTVTLVNPTAHAIDLTQWALVLDHQPPQPLTGVIAPGAFQAIAISGVSAASIANGGIITLLNSQGIKIDGVSYTRADCQKLDGTIIFAKKQ